MEAIRHHFPCRGPRLKMRPPMEVNPLKVPRNPANSRIIPPHAPRTTPTVALHMGKSGHRIPQICDDKTQPRRFAEIGGGDSEGGLASKFCQHGCCAGNGQ